MEQEKLGFFSRLREKFRAYCEAYCEMRRLV